ncbi:hypothetical protein ACLJJ6_03470 [Pediococcus siamensis]|uniref:hypothetical protein n=1 Tax=Pediococcus siamensis TaxID=381829 RepID=UPI0039A3B880
MRFIYPKNKAGYVLLTALIFLTLFSGLTLQLEHNQQAASQAQTQINEANDARILCNLLILKRQKDPACQKLITNIGQVEISAEKFVVTLDNKKSFKFALSDQPL